MLPLILLLSLAAETGAPAPGPAQGKPVRVVAWVSDGHCGAAHMKPGGAACVRKCIAGAEHVNPEWKPGGMVLVTDDRRLWRVDNPDVLWGHESRQLELEAVLDEQRMSARVVKVVRVRRR